MENKMENNTEVKKEMTMQAIDRALQQIKKNWNLIQNQELITEQEWTKAGQIIIKSINKHIEKKYGI